MLKKVIIAFVVVLSLTAFINPVLTDEPLKLRFGSMIPAESPWEEGINEYIKAAETQSGNSIKFKTYLGGQLGGEVEMIKDVAMGSLNGGAFTLAAISEALSLPILQVYEMPFLFDSNEEADYVMDKTFDFMAKQLEKKGLVLIMWGTNGWRCFGTKEIAIRNVEDLKGLKMRSQESDVYVKFYQTLGATPVPIATPDVLIALKTKMVDGYDQTPVFSLSTGWVNSSKYFTASKHIYQPGALVVSKKFYDKLSAENKKALVPPADKREGLQNISRKLVRAEQKDILESLPEMMNIEVITLTAQQRAAFKKASQPVYTSMEAKFGAGILKLVNVHINKFRSQN